VGLDGFSPAERWKELRVPGVDVLACTWVSTKSCPRSVLFWDDPVCRDEGKPTSQGWVHHCSPTGTTAVVGKTRLGRGAVAAAYLSIFQTLQIKMKAQQFP